MRLAWVALVAGTGCAQIAGIDETSGPTVTTDTASISVQRVSIGSTVVKAPQDMSAQSGTFYDDSAGALAPVPGTFVAPNTFTAELGGTPPATITVPMEDTSVTRRMYATPSAMQQVSLNVLERPGAEPALANSVVDFAFTAPSTYTTGESFAFLAVGAWSQIAINEVPAVDTTSTIDPAPIPYSSFMSAVGRDLVRITSADVALVLRYTGATLSGVLQTQLDQTDATDAITGTMTAVAATNTLQATIAGPTWQTRFNAVRPNLGGESVNWRLTAAPGWSVGDPTGVRLSNGIVDPAATTLGPFMFGNPFESLDWKSVLVFSASAVRNATITSEDGTMSAPAGLQSSLTSFLDPATTTDISLPAGLAITITANGTALTTDNQTVALDVSAPVEIGATLDRTSNTLYGLGVIEIALDPSIPALTRTSVLDVMSTSPTFRLPADTFQVGKQYYLQYRAYAGGYDAAATGDLTKLTLPYTTGIVESAVFEVEAP